MGSFLKNLVIVCLVVLFSVGSFGLYLCDDIDKEDEQSTEFSSVNISFLELKNINPNDLIAGYEQTLEELNAAEFQSWNKYYLIAKYMVPRMLAWAAGAGFLFI